MKKGITLVLILICVLGVSGYQNKIKTSELYAFPEPTIQITGSFYSQGQVTVFEIGSEKYDADDLSTLPVIRWFYSLELTACDEPEVAEGAENYHFDVNGENAFIYEDRGSEAYIIIDGNYYKVSNPSVPPVK